MYPDAKEERVTLSEGKAGMSYVIRRNVYGGKARARMDSLGLVEGETVHVLSNTFSGLIVIIKGSRLAVCKAVADALEIG